MAEADPLFATGVLNTSLFFLQKWTPGVFSLLRRLWWRLRYRVPAPGPDQGNCQDYAHYRQLIAAQMPVSPGEADADLPCIELVPGQPLRGTGASSSGIAVYIAAGGELLPGAIDQFAQVLAAHPDALCVYCDQEIGRSGSPELLPMTVADPVAWRHGAPMPGCFALHTGALEQLPPDHDASRADWPETLLRLLEFSPGLAVRHLPLPLFRLPTAVRLPAAPAMALRGCSALPSLSVIIPTRDGGQILRACIDSLLPAVDLAAVECEVLVVDNDSRDGGTLDYLAGLDEATNGRVKVLRYPEPFNFAAINNWAVEQCRGEAILLLNDDVEAGESTWLSRMLACLAQDDVGVVGAQLRYPDGRLQHAGVALGLGGVAEHPGKRLQPSDPRLQRWAGAYPRQVSAVTGACLLTRRTLYCDLGGMNAQKLPVAFNDIDYCLKVSRAGWRVVYTPAACLTHHESVSRGAEDSLVKHRRFTAEIAYMKQQWAAQIADDPFYSPHLSLHANDLSFRNPPSERLGRSRCAGSDRA